MAKTIEELEDKILSGDFDEYTLNEYNSAIRSNQRKIDIENACDWLMYELTSTMDEAIKNGNAIEYIIYKFKKSMEEEQ